MPFVEQRCLCFQDPVHPGSWFRVREVAVFNSDLNFSICLTSKGAVDQVVHDATLSDCAGPGTSVGLLTFSEEACNFQRRGSSKGQVHSCHYPLSIV